MRDLLSNCRFSSQYIYQQKKESVTVLPEAPSSSVKQVF